MKPASIVCLVAAFAALSAQTPPVSVLEVQADNVVIYVLDTTDILSWGTLRGPVPAATLPTPSFKRRMTLGDVVSVNGQPAKGNVVIVAHNLLAVTELTPGRALMDMAQGDPFLQVHSFMLPDGAFVGSITAGGSGVGGRPPGAPANAISGAGVVVGGTGVFFGVRGQAGLIGSSGVRNASMTEDPAYRRLNGGGKMTWFYQLIPATWPEVLSLPSGPAIFHGADFSPVTPEKPATAGELLIMSVSGLGPVKGTVELGQPFPPDNTLEVNSPVDVTVNGRRADVVNKVGWPAMTNVYRVDFVVPESTAPGMASIVPAVAWIKGSEAKIPVR